jgi:hypothetical protein
MPQTSGSALLWKAYFALPPTMRVTLRAWLKGGAGHTSSIFNSMIAKRDARGKCRIDKAATVLCRYLSVSGLTPLEGRRCLELGTGYVGSTPVVMWLLGAATVTTIDLNSLLVVDSLRQSIRLTDRMDLFRLLQPYVTSERALEERLVRMYAWLDSNLDNLPEGITYLAPCDLLSYEFSSQFDFVFSVSTLEHIPRSIVGPFVGRMASVLAKGGACLHAIDLSDHLDSANNPLGFLAIDRRDYCEDANADSRGNRIRNQEWLDIFSSSGLSASIVESDRATASRLPERLADPFDRMAMQDLLPTSVLIRSHKAPAMP